MKFYKRGGAGLALLLNVVLCISLLPACDDWKRYSMDFQAGTFRIDRSEAGQDDYPYLTAETQFEISFEQPAEESEAFLSSGGFDGRTVYFLFRHAEGAEEIKYGYTANRSLTFYVTLKDGGEYGFTIYSYDWSDTVYIMNSYIYFTV